MTAEKVRLHFSTNPVFRAVSTRTRWSSIPQGSAAIAVRFAAILKRLSNNIALLPLLRSTRDPAAALDTDLRSPYRPQRHARLPARSTALPTVFSPGNWSNSLEMAEIHQEFIRTEAESVTCSDNAEERQSSGFARRNINPQLGRYRLLVATIAVGRGAGISNEKRGSFWSTFGIRVVPSNSSSILGVSPRATADDSRTSTAMRGIGGSGGRTTGRNPDRQRCSQDSEFRSFPPVRPSPHVAVFPTQFPTTIVSRLSWTRTAPPACGRDSISADLLFVNWIERICALY